MSKFTPILCAVFGFGSFIGAKYQFDQKKETETCIERIHEHLTSAAIECPADLTEKQIASEYKYKRVSVCGVIDNNNTVIIGPRQPPSSTPHYKILNPNSWGGYVYSPLRTESGDIIIVNRGWIPKHELPEKDKTFVCKKRLGDDYRVYEGIVSLESPPFSKNEKQMKTNNDIESIVWQFRDKGYSKEKLRKEFVVVDILSPQNEYGEYPHRLTEDDVVSMIHVPPKQHMIYACSLLSAGTILLGFSYYLIKRPSRITSINAAVLCGFAWNSNKNCSNFSCY